MAIVIVGIDLSKNVFVVHCVDSSDNAVLIHLSVTSTIATRAVRIVDIDQQHDRLLKPKWHEP